MIFFLPAGTELGAKLMEFPCPRYLIKSKAELELHNRIENAAIWALWSSEDGQVDTSSVTTGSLQLFR